MGRRGLFSATAVVIAALGVVALGPFLESGCTGTEGVACAELGCPNAANQISAHLHVPVGELLGATTTACWRTQCITLFVANDGGADADLDGDVPLQGSGQEFAGGVLHDEGDGWTRIETSVSPVKVEADRSVTLVRPANGDDYRISVKAADGTPLLDVDRSVTYTVDRPSSYCSGECLSAVISVYATSPSGACTAIACDGVELHTRFVDQDDARGARITVCRNRRCAVGLGATFAPLEGTSSDLLVRPTFDDYRGPLEVTLMVDVENTALVDGDQYTLEVAHLNGTLTSFERTAAYETSFPNGSCDPYPCRHVRFEVP